VASSAVSWRHRRDRWRDAVGRRGELLLEGLQFRERALQGQLRVAVVDPTLGLPEQDAALGERELFERGLVALAKASDLFGRGDEPGLELGDAPVLGLALLAIVDALAVVHDASLRIARDPVEPQDVEGDQ
jgi:hypothetical protein